MAISSAELAKLRSAITDLEARTSVNRYLLEQLYAAAFHGRTEVFSALMTRVTDSLLASGRPLGEAPQEAADDLKARIALHLERFRQAVATRLEAR